LQSDVAEAQMVDQRERLKIHTDALVRLADIEAKYGTQVNVAHIEALIAHDQELAKAGIAADAEKHGHLVQALSQPPVMNAGA